MMRDPRKRPLAVIPYVSGVSELIRKVYEKFDLRVVFKSGPTLCSLLTRVKDPLPKGESGRCGLPDPLPVQ